MKVIYNEIYKQENNNMNMFKIKIIALVLMSLSFVFEGYTQDNKPFKGTGEGESQLPSGKNWKLVWSDEFDGNKLDRSKWDFRLHIMQTRHETWTDDAVELDGKGHLMMKLYEKNGQYFSSQIQTGRNFMDVPGNQYGKTKLAWPIAELEPAKFLHKYGYYEVRCKLPTQEGWWAAFWLQSPVIGSTLDPADSGVEVDIMENFTRDGIISQNVHWNGYGKNHKHKGTGKLKMRPSDNEFHTFGVYWSPEGYVFYMDGKETWRVSDPVSNREQFILLSTECNGYREGAPADVLKKALLPDYFIVDYVRVYDEVK